MSWGLGLGGRLRRKCFEGEEDVGDVQEADHLLPLTFRQKCHTQANSASRG